MVHLCSNHWKRSKVAPPTWDYWSFKSDPAKQTNLCFGAEDFPSHERKFQQLHNTKKNWINKIGRVRTDFSTKAQETITIKYCSIRDTSIPLLTLANGLCLCTVHCGYFLFLCHLSFVIKEKVTANDELFTGIVSFLLTHCGTLIMEESRSNDSVLSSHD